MTFVALTRTGKWFKCDSRDLVDKWASYKCAEGQDVNVYVIAYIREMREPRQLIGKWRPVKS